MRAGKWFAIVFSAFCVLNAQAQAPNWNEATPSNEIEKEDDTENRYTRQLVSEHKQAMDDALLLYTEYSSANGAELKIFLKNIARFSNETLRSFGDETLDGHPECRQSLLADLKKIEYDAHKKASFCAENHAKYFKGPMLVFRMHLNKTEEYIQKCERELQVYGPYSENSPRMRRWRRLALSEIHRVNDDIIHSRKSYKDILLHIKRKFKAIRRQANESAQHKLRAYRNCQTFWAS